MPPRVCILIVISESQQQLSQHQSQRLLVSLRDARLDNVTFQLHTYKGVLAKLLLPLNHLT